MGRCGGGGDACSQERVDGEEGVRVLEGGDALQQGVVGLGVGSVELLTFTLTLTLTLSLSLSLSLSLTLTPTLTLTLTPLSLTCSPAQYGPQGPVEAGWLPRLAAGSAEGQPLLSRLHVPTCVVLPTW